MNDHVLVVEDERDIAEILNHVLKAEGYRVTVAHDGISALDLLRRYKHDLVILDLMLPGMSGLEVLKATRASDSTRATPLIVLTARGEEVDRVLGFELGADDYVTKPFSPRELVLRVRAMLRRSVPGSPGETGTLAVGPIEVDLGAHEVTVGGKRICLTITEFRLLVDLLRARGRTRSRESLLSEVWGYHSEILSRTVDTHIRRLRAKLAEAAEWLDTVRGVGYRIQDPSRASQQDKA